MLEVDSPPHAKNLPVGFLIHGGDWQVGAKSAVPIKPQAFMDRGFVVVSTNDKRLPKADVETVVRDIARSIIPLSARRPMIHPDIPLARRNPSAITDLSSS